MKQYYQTLTIIVFLLLLFGCSSIPAAQINDRMNGWSGVHINQLIKYWGLPSSQREVAGENYAEWLNRSSEPGNAAVSIGTGSHSRHSSIGIGITMLSLGAKENSCSRLVIYDDDGIVKQISWQGTQDFCYEITPDISVIRKNKALMEQK